MDQQMIIRFLSDKKEVGLIDLYNKFSVKSPKAKTALHGMLSTWERCGALRFNKATKSIVIVSPSKFVQGKSRSSAPGDKIARPPIRLEGVEQDLPLIIQRYDLPKKFSSAVLQEIDAQDWEKQPDLPREDLKDLFIITIDGSDSKDLDDAVHVKRTANGYELGVHIADVSHYVAPSSALDNEARTRANSYYLINTVLPMLPPALSNDLCSLNPQTEKRTMSIFMDFSAEGFMRGYRICASTICTRYRMTYDRVQEIMDGASENDAELAENIGLMAELFQLLLQNRLSKGSIDFNFKEKKIVLDDEGLPTKVYLKDRQNSERLIEEFMLSANIAAATFLHDKGLGVYRVHDTPPPEKYTNLKAFAAKQGIKLPDVPKPKDLQTFLLGLKDSPMLASAEILTLRSMSQAVYQAENIGHFGLGFTFYTHFTSPIRRYADLLVHRLIKYFLYGVGTPYELAWLEKTCTYISGMERTAMEAERDFFKIKAVRYMKPLEGQDLTGAISSVAAFGIFVEVDNTGIEAMVRYSDMKGYVVFDEVSLSAKAGNKIYRLGDPAKIRLTRVNVERGFIDAEFID
ncbi:MAG: ribonuclease R family protein [Brevinema sp.]